MKNNKRLGVGIVIVALVIIGIVLYSRLGVSADSIEASKGTTIQLVDEKGDKVERAIPLKLVLSGTIRKCATTRIFGFRASRCRTANKTINAVTTTDATGKYLVSTSTYRPLTKEELKGVAETLLAEQLNRPLTAEELTLLQKIVYEIAGLKIPSIEQINSIIAKFSTGTVGLAIKPAFIQLMTLNPIFLGGLFTGRQFGVNDTIASAALSSFGPVGSFASVVMFSGSEEHNFQMTSVVVSATSDYLKSDSPTISFYATDYKPSVNLVLSYTGTRDLALMQEAYFKKVDTENTDETIRAAIKKNITDFVAYAPYYYVHIGAALDAKINALSEVFKGQ